MKNWSLLGPGVVGSTAAALCCFIPVLVILLDVVGLSSIIGWLDYVLFPILALFLGVTVVALWRARSV